MVSFSVPSSEPIGSVGTITLDSDPSFASPSVSSGPLQITVHVNAAPPVAGVLFAGGQDWSGNALATAEIWDPATKSVFLRMGRCQRPDTSTRQRCCKAE